MKVPGIVRGQVFGRVLAVQALVSCAQSDGVCSALPWALCLETVVSGRVMLKCVSAHAP